MDLFTDEDGGVQAAAKLVKAALVDAGMAIDVIPETSELGELFYGFDRDIVEFEVHQGEHAVRLQLVRFDRRRSPLMMEIGPVLHIDDVVGSKVAAMATRAEPRDFIDVAAVLGSRSPQRLGALALQAGQHEAPALGHRDTTKPQRWVCRRKRLHDALAGDRHERMNLCRLHAVHRPRAGGDRLRRRSVVSCRKPGALATTGRRSVTGPSAGQIFTVVSSDPEASRPSGDHATDATARS